MAISPDWKTRMAGSGREEKLKKKKKTFKKLFKVYVCELNILDSVIGSSKKIEFDDAN